VVRQLTDVEQGVFYGAVDGRRPTVKSGRGIYYLSNGDVFEGKWLDDKPQEGAFVDHVNGYFFIGQFKSNSSDASQGGGGFFLTGHPFDGALEGRMEYCNVEVYTGCLENHGCLENKRKKILRHGRGISERFDGSTYNGMRSGGKKNGFGVLTYPNGARSIGNWKDGKHDGTQFDLSSENAKLSGSEAAGILDLLKGMQPQSHARDRVPIFTPFMQMMRLLRSRFSAFRARASIPTIGLCCRSFPL
jgi:hypothetical protein